MHIITSDGTRIWDSVTYWNCCGKMGLWQVFFSISVKFGETLQKSWLENEKKPEYPNLSLNIITRLDHHFNILVLSPSSVDSSRTLNIMRKG